jgi:VWFA-related protein
VTVNAVLLPVVARDSHGRAVGTLQKEDFQVFDNNKSQVISGFIIQKRAGVVSKPASTEREPVRPESAPPPPTTPERYVAFLFDDMHLEAGDLQRAQKVATKMIGESLNESDRGLVLSFSGVNSGFTRDLAKLQEAIAKLKMQTLYRHIGRQCPDVDYYKGNLIVNQHNEQALESATQDAMSCGHTDMRSAAEALAMTAARQVVAMGDQDVHVTLDFVTNVVRKMGTLPGQRTLILVSPGFLTLTPEAMAEKSEILDAAAQSNVTISALDARGLFTTEVEVGEHATGTIMDMMTGKQSEDHSNTMTQSEDIMAELADGTGGTFFQNSNDLEGGFQTLAEGPEYVYLLELSPEKVKQDGTYHRLKVNVDQPGLSLEARRGYFAPKREKK